MRKEGSLVNRWKIVPAVILILLIATFSVSAQDVPAGTQFQIEFRSGPMWIGNAFQVDAEGQKVHSSAVSPLRMTPGIAGRYILTPYTVVSLGIDGLYQEYVELPEGSPMPGKVVPTSSHTGSDSKYFEIQTAEDEKYQNVAGVLILPLHIGVDFPFINGEVLSSGPGIGITILNRIPFLIEGESTQGILAYHWGFGRFVFPEMNWEAAFHTFDRFDYGFRVRSLWPVANLWALEEGVAWWDGLTLQLQAFIRISL